MKFIVDAQLPKQLSNLLNWKGFDSIHTLDLEEKNATDDSKIYQISSNEDRIIITKDSDFLNTHLLSNNPKKLILINTGNISNTDLLHIFINNLDKILDINENDFIEIRKEKIIIH